MKTGPRRFAQPPSPAVNQTKTKQHKRKKNKHKKLEAGVNPFPPPREGLDERAKLALHLRDLALVEKDIAGDGNCQVRVVCCVVCVPSISTMNGSLPSPSAQ